MNSVIVFVLLLSVPQQEGLFYIYSPHTTPHRYIGVDFSFTISSSPYPFGSTEHNHNYLSSDLSFSYGVSDYLEAFVTPKLYTKIATCPDDTLKDSYFAIGISYLETGVALYVPFQIYNSLLRVGFRPSVTFCLNTANPSGDEKEFARIGFGPQPYHAPDYSFNLLGEYELGKFSALLNLGYVIRGESYRSSDENRRSGLDVGTGVEFQPSPSCIFGMGFVAVENGKKIFLSPQVKLGNPLGTFLLGVHIPLSKFDFIPDEQVHKYLAFGLGYKAEQKALKTEPPWVVKIVGVVLDSVTHKPLDAGIEVYGPDVGWVECNRKTGEFSFALKKPGAYRITASRGGYYSVTDVAKLMSCDSLFCRFVLNRVIDISLRGRIVEAGTGMPLSASVKLLGEKRYDTVSDSASGTYNFWADIGTYNLTVEKRGYLKKTVPVYITNTSSMVIDVELEKSE
ncbi:hypothetical protein CH333_03765 [candidate division WOR-3 bacterium JGI_Cruoil_03_44_89]|uniref:PEGA domain-containing protein n=1 Tax=candidate division WOR-3 bacterium JGI_Cruoil_03_44_89 TaxID=1973748 RepID=A0A235BVM1_UNCW3|nr:MAG: hypothetical protein CH333_03765 [candidate division WOR-3 bacterium JGI_Cruoil_03_44_89]